jgi:hypothetical protein
MNDSHRRHLFALLVQLEDTVSRITQAGWMGISPSGGGQRLTPLPPAQWRMLQEALERLVDSYHDALSRLVPDLTKQHDQPEPIETTYYWLRLLLGSLHDSILPELDPERFEKRYGELSEDEREALRRLQRTMERELKHAQDIAQMHFLPKR